MSQDLSRPLAPSSGNLDAYDALVIWRLLSDAADRVLGDEGGGGRLGAEVEAARKLVAPWWRGYGSDDPLDLGESLWLSHWFGGMDSRVVAAAAPAGGGGDDEGGDAGGGGDEEADLGRVSDWVAARALEGLEELWAGGHFAQPRRRRLGFRELGATLGVQVRRR